MKAILKTVWFALTIILQDYITKPIAPLADKVATHTPSIITKIIDIKDFSDSTFVHQVIFVIVLFLGLDIISGDIKGLVKGPIKLAFNAALYLVGFSVVFFLLNSFAISFS